MTDFKVPPGSKLEIELRRKRKRGRPAPTPAADERGLVEASGESARYVFRDSPGFTLLDLGARLVTPAPYSYRELDFYRPVDYSYASVETTDATHFVQITRSLPADLWDAYEAALTGGDPFGYTTVGGRKTPNALPLNHETPGRLGEAVVDFYATPEPGDVFGPYRTFALDLPGDGPAWRWAPSRRDAAEWSADVTAQALAPDTGRYVRRAGPRLLNFYVWDRRYWDFYFRRVGYKLTEVPDAGAPASTPELEFPLRVFGAPTLWHPTEEVGAMALQTGQPAPDDPGFVFASATCTVQEWFVSSVTRAAQIPVPAVGLDGGLLNQSPEVAAEWLALFPEERFGLTVKRKARLATGVENYYDPENMPPIINVPSTVTWEVFPGRRPRPLAEIEAEAVAQAQADVLDIDTTPTWTDTRSVPLGFVSVSMPTGRLIGAVEVKGKVYYVWKT